MSWPDEPFLNLRQTATPKGTPANGGALLYVKSDGKLYTKNSAGVEALVADSASLFLAKANNLSDLTNAATARTNLGLGTAATQSVTGSVVGTTDTQTLTNKTLSTGTKVGAATTDISGAWVSFTPTWTGLTIGNATVDAKYMQIGKTVTFFISVTMGSTTAFGANWTATLPVTARIGGEYRFPIGMKDASAANNYIGTTFNHTTTVMNLAITGGTNGLLPGTITSTVPFAWAVSDLLTISGTYEAA